MYQIILHQIFDTNVKDVTLYVSDYNVALGISESFIKDPSALDVFIYRDKTTLKKLINEINFVKCYGKIF